MSNFSPNAISRGAQLTFVGAYRALQNPQLFSSVHYRQAGLAVAAGIAISLLVTIPTYAVRLLLWLALLFRHGSTSNNSGIVETLEFVEHSVLQLPLFLLTLMRYITPALDQMFMDSLHWVDRTYVQKHESEDPRHLRALYYPNLSLYGAREQHLSRREAMSALTAFLTRFAWRSGISLAVYFLSYLPLVGRSVLPAASFYAFQNAVGVPPALVIFSASIVVPKRYLVIFLQTYFSSRTLMRELLEPYFSRVHFTREQKSRWFRDRQGVLFGFGIGFFMVLKVPILGVLIYGIAEASTAYLITKVTDPPPPPSEAAAFVESQLLWKNKHEFLKLPLDALNVEMRKLSRAE